MNETKSWYQSKTIIGIIVTFLATILAALKLVGIDFGIGEAEVTALIMALFALVGTITAIVGRVKAQKAIGFRAKPNGG
ncbi:MAG: hypothetical protein V1754_10120 [Pseudomonadota bacterium]